MKEWAMNETVDPFRSWDAAYVLGSLGMDDRREYERHLLSCPACTKAVGEIAGIPGILMKISPETALALLNESSDNEENFELHEKNVVQSLAKAAVARKHRIRQRFVAVSSVAAALLMVIGIGIGTHISPDSPGVVGTRITMTQLVPNSMTVNLHVVEKKWGTQINWDCTYAQLQPDSQSAEPYDLVVTNKAGVSTVVATWRAVGMAAQGLMASTNIPLTQIRSIDIRDAGSSHPIVQGEV